MAEKNPQKQPLVSIIIPTYNRPEYLNLALASAVQQTYQNIEIIVSDNCSPE
ncbi:MAG: glycosyltransferase, partial [Cyanobacteria bacterium J06628_3]